MSLYIFLNWETVQPQELTLMESMDFGDYDVSGQIYHL